MRTKQIPVPIPTVMPGDRETWASQLNLSNFVNTYYQYRDLQICGDLKKLLIIGPGQGLDTQVLKWRGYDVRTFDIDNTFKPNFIGSIHDMPMFRDRQFDAVIASHVLEHLPEPYLNTALHEISRVSQYALVYLPVTGRHFQWRFKGDIKGIDISCITDIYNFLHRPDGVTPRYCSNQHFWEVGMRRFRISDLKARFSEHFELLKVYRNKDWNPSQNFILKSKVITP